MGMIQSLRVLTRQQWRDQHGEGFVVAWETSGAKGNRCRGKLSIRRRRRSIQVQRSPEEVCAVRARMMKSKSFVSHPLLMLQCPVQALITQPRGLRANDAPPMMLMITTIGKETGHLYWKVAMATHCDPFSANHGSGGTMGLCSTHCQYSFSVMPQFSSLNLIHHTYLIFAQHAGKKSTFHTIMMRIRARCLTLSHCMQHPPGEEMVAAAFQWWRDAAALIHTNGKMRGSLWCPPPVMRRLCYV